MAKEIMGDVKEMNGKWQHLVEYCLDLYEDIKASDYRQKKITEIEDSNNAYAQTETATTDPWDGASNICLPLTTISVDNLEPRLVAGMTGKKPYIEFEMESEQPKDEVTERLETWFNNELEEVVRIEDIAGDIAHGQQLDGTVYLLAEYDIEEVVRRDFLLEGQEGETPEEAEQAIRAMMSQGYQPINGVWVQPDGEPVTIERKVPVFEGVTVKPIPFSDIYIPDDADDWEKTPVLRKVRPTYAELMRDKDTKKGYMNIGPWLVSQGEKDIKSEDMTPVQSIDDVRVRAKEVIECLECSISYIYRDENTDEEDITDFTEERLIATITLDKGVLIRLMLLRDVNYRNEHVIKRIRMYSERGKSYGTSVYGKMKSIQIGASKTFNMAINIAEVVLIPWFLFTDKVGLKGKVHKLVPGQGIPVDDISGLYFPTFNINPSQMMSFMEPWLQFWERLLSIGDLQVGRPSQKATTATETMAVIQEGNIKHNYQTQSYREEYLSLIRTVYDLYYQNMPFDKTFLYNGEYVPIPRSDMVRPTKFRLTGSTELSNKLIERKENEDFYGFAASDPHGIFNPIKVAQDLVKSYGRTNVEEYINPTLNKISKVLQEMPEAAELFEQAVQETMQIAQRIEQGGQDAVPEA